MKTRLSRILTFALACAAPAAAAQQPVAPRQVDLVIAATTDVHGRVRGWDYYDSRPDTVRGLTRAATIVDSVRQANPGRVVLVDAGDLLQGTPIDYVAARVRTTEPHPAIAAMNAMQYDAAAVGNHEFNYGVPTLRRAVAQAHFPFLAANAWTTGGARAFRAYTIVRRAGVRVAIVGATTPGSNLWDGQHLKEAHLVIRDAVPDVRTAVAQARRAGADVVVLAIHSGLDEPSSYDTVSSHLPSENVAARIAHEVPGIDVIVYGHSHKEMPDTVIGSTLLMQPRNWATSVAVAHLALTKAGRRWTVISRASGVVRTAGHAEDPKILAVTDAAHRATLEYVTRPIGTTPVAWRADSARVVDTPLMDFVLDVERKASGADLASASAFNLDAGLDSGAITVARLAAIYPYENTLRAVRISGAQLKAYLEWSARYYRTLGTPGSLIEPNVPGYNFDIVAGVDYTMDISRPAGERITSLTRNGRPVAPTDSFTLALNNYRQSGGGGYAMLRDAPVVYDRQQDIRQLLIDEVTQRKELRPADYYHHGNWTLAPGSAVAAAYRAMHRVAGQGEVTQPARPRTGAPRGATLSGPHLRIIGTNDFHGALEPRPDNTGHLRGGAAAVAGAIEAAERECAPPNCYSILLDGGDEFQGTPESNLAFGRPVTAVFNRLNLAASALGNHEFDWGVDTLRARIAQARYAILGANVRTTDGKPLPWLRADTIVERGPYRIGVIGLATVSTPTTTKASNTVGLRFEQPAPIVDSLAANLRAHGADFVVVIAHAGAFCGRGESATCDGEIITLAQQVTQKIDAIVSGHTHSLVNTVVRGIPIVQAQSSGQAIDVVDLPYDATPHEPLPPAVHQVRPVYTDSIAPDTAIARMVREASASIAPIVNRPVATIAEDMIRQGREYPLGDLIADAMRVEGKGDFGIMNNGGIRANLRAGQATYGSLFEVQPFGNLLYRVTARGADFRAYFEQLVARGAPNVHISGIVITYDPAREAGHRITSLLPTDGRAFSDTATYSIVMNDFMATGGDGLGFAHAAISSQPLDIVDLDALIAYLSAQPQPVHAPRGLRFVQEGAQ